MMVKRQYILDEEIAEQIRKLAFDERRSASEIIREAVTAYLEKKGKRPR